MFNNTVKQLFLKDLSRIRIQWLCYGLLGVASLIIMAIPLPFFGHAGSIFLMTVMIAYYCHIVVKLIVIERKEKNELFFMSLPVELKTLRQAKFFSCLAGFLLIWLPLAIATLLLVSSFQNWPAVSLAFYSMIFASFVPGFLVILSVALCQKSEGWTIFSLVLSNVSVTVATNAFPNTPNMKHGFSLGSVVEAGIVWPDGTSTILYATAALAIGILMLTYFILRKRPCFI